MKKFICGALAAVILTAGFATACASGNDNEPSLEDVKTVSGLSYNLTLPQNSVTATLKNCISLPVPAAFDSSGNDLSENVMVEVVYEDGVTYIPEHKYGAYSQFTAYTAGNYYALYTLKDGSGEIVAKNTVKIQAVKKSYTDDGMKVDGVLDEENYSANAAFTTGVGNNMEFMYYFGENGLYMGVNVKDNNLVYSDYVVSRLTQSDGFEVYFNLSDERSDILNDKCFKVQVGLAGDVYVYTASTGKTFFEVSERIVPEYKLNIHGTRSKVGAQTLAKYDEDEGYTFEAYIEYSQLGIDVLPEVGGVAFAHRDVKSNTEGTVASGSANNEYFKSVTLPDNITQITSNNGKDYWLEWFDHFAVTKLYSDLKIKTDKNSLQENLQGV